MTTVAIDFGTSNTIVARLEPDTQTGKTLRLPGLSRLLKLKVNRDEPQEVALIPTLVFVDPQGELVVGETVRSRRLGLAEPQRLFKTFKRDLATDFQPPARLLDGTAYSTEAIAEAFLHTLWDALRSQSIEPTQLIFTLPVGAFDRYLEWFRQVGRNLGVADVRLVDESTVAALGYAIHHPGALVLVVDFGGGTLDLSLVRTVAVAEPTTVQRAEVLAKSDAYVGGEDIDRWIVEDYLQGRGSSREAIGAMGWQNLLAIAEQVKIRLSSTDAAKESWLDEDTFTAYDLTLDRTHFEELLEAHQFLEHLRRALDEVLAIALGKGIHKKDIEQVLLVGGSCLIPAVQTLIQSYFGRQRVKLNKPFEAIAHGALAVSQFTQVADYLRHSYAIRLWEPHSRSYSYFALFEQGCAYPCQRAEPLTLQVAIDGQQEVRLDIGEVAEVEQAEVIYDAQGRMTSCPLRRQSAYRSLESQHGLVCVAHLDPPGQVGVDRIAVDFEVTAARMLVATVRDLLTQQVLVQRGAIAKLQ